MKKKIILITIVVIALLILLIPQKRQYTDGGTVEYKSLTYDVTKYNRMSDSNTVLVGTEVKILGFTVYDNTELQPEK